MHSIKTKAEFKEFEPRFLVDLRRGSNSLNSDSSLQSNNFVLSKINNL